MDEQYTPIISEEERAARRASRAEARRRKQQELRRRRMKQLLPAAAFLLILAVILLVRNGGGKQETETPEAQATPISAPAVIPEEPEAPYAAAETASTVHLSDGINSGYAVVIDLQSDTILAEKNARAVISPASMTKIMTLLVAVENLKSLSDTVSITIEITDYCYVNGCSVVGYEIGETVTVPGAAVRHHPPLRRGRLAGSGRLCGRLPGGFRGADESKGGGIGPFRNHPLYQLRRHLR